MIQHYPAGSRATRCWQDVNDYCPRKPVVRVTTETRSRHLCALHFEEWKRSVREVATATRGNSLRDDMRRRVDLELAAVEEDERREKVRNGL